QAADGKPAGLLADAFQDPDFARALLDGIGRRRQWTGESGNLVATPTRAFRGLRPDGARLDPAPVPGEQSNSSVRFGDHLVLKMFRRLSEGVNPELEIGRFLTEGGRFAHVAPLA